MTRIFISSTFTDLEDHRAKVIEALTRAGRGYSAMEFFGSRSTEPWPASKKELETCDLFVGIYAWRYGTVPRERKWSITELEFHHATRLGLKRLCYVIDENHPWPADQRDTGHDLQAVLALRQRVSKLVRSTFTTPDDLAWQVSADVSRELGLPEDSFSRESTASRQLEAMMDQAGAAGLGARSNTHFPLELIDQRIEHEVEILRKSRFFTEFDSVAGSLTLGKRLVDGDLSGGTDSLRARAIATCARFLVYRGDSEAGAAEDYLAAAQALGTCDQVDIARAFLSSMAGEKGDALGRLASIGSAASRSAALAVVNHHDGPAGALTWLGTTQTAVSDLDADGKNMMLTIQLELGHWDEAEASASQLALEDLEETPVLHHAKAMAVLLPTVPEEFRSLVFNQVPLRAVDFPLAGDTRGMGARRLALAHFLKLAAAAKELECPIAAAAEMVYALWLKLRDPDTAASGRGELESLLENPMLSLHFVPLALQFGLHLDLAAVERQIDREIAMRGQVTTEAATARLAVALSQGTPESIAECIETHLNQLCQHIDRKCLTFLLIEASCRAGLSRKARVHLSSLERGGLSGDEGRRLRQMIAEAEGEADPVEFREDAFKTTGFLNDLLALVDLLEAEGHWDGLCTYASVLFEKTHSLHAAKQLARALSATNRNEELVAFLTSYKELREQSTQLQMLYSWGLYQIGDLAGSQNEYSKIPDDYPDKNYRNLGMRLSITSGDWSALAAFSAGEYRKKNERTAVELIETAKLASYSDSPLARELVFEAAQKGQDDPNILSAAYFLAVAGGWDDEPCTHEWLERAAELSGTDGPIQKVGIEELFNRRPEWEKREAEIWGLLSRGEIPVFLAAESLNRSLIDMFLFPALLNQKERDPRRRALVPAYSGKRAPTTMDQSKVVGVEATALLTLGLLDLVDAFLNAFGEVVIPHSTMGWLFEEKQKVGFHQPSRVKEARRIVRLVAAGVLNPLGAEATASSNLASQVGEELAALVAQAQLDRNEGRPATVVQAPPIYRVSSLMQEQADVSDYSGLLNDCAALVHVLRSLGKITGEEERRALAYLQLHERSWGSAPEVEAGTSIYLSDLSAKHLLHLSLLETLSSAGFRVIVSARLWAEANALVARETTAGEVMKAIERIRVGVSAGLADGRISVAPCVAGLPSDQAEIPEHPSIDVLRLAGRCDLILSDDRYFNQHQSIEQDGERASTVCTLDLLSALEACGSIAPREHLEFRTSLRRAGYVFVPTTETELRAHLAEVSVSDKRVRETAELTAIRENILCVRMGDWLQLPAEAAWLDQTFVAFTAVLKGLWVTTADPPHATACSDWLLRNMESRGWAHRLVGTEECIFRLQLTTHVGPV